MKRSTRTVRYSPSIILLAGLSLLVGPSVTFSTLPASFYAHAANSSQAIKSDAQRRQHLLGFYPRGERDPKTKELKVYLDEVYSLLIPALKELGTQPKTIRVWLDATTHKDVPAENVVDKSKQIVRFPGKPVNRQADVDIEILDGHGKTLHFTEHALFESLNYPTAHGYEKYPVPEMALPKSALGKFEVDTELVKISGQVQRLAINWIPRPDSKNKALIEAFKESGSDLNVSRVFDQNWKPVGVKVIHKGKIIPAKDEDFYFTAGAGFSWNFFHWDSQVVARAIRYHLAPLSEETRQLWRKTQKSFGTGKGDIRRELRWNLTPYQRPNTVKLAGQPEVNLESFNPPLDGWAQRQVLRLNPKTAQQILPDVIETVKGVRTWLENEKGIAVRDTNGELIGFRWTGLGNGRDNAITGDLFVDLICYHKMLIDQQREFSLMLGKFNEAQELTAQSEKIKKLINEKYWNEELNGFVDLVADGKGGFKPGKTLNATTFWPAMAGAVEPDRLQRLLKNGTDPKRFGGPFLPSLSRDNPKYVAEGGYWQGGGWPPDWVMYMDVLLENGFRADAKDFTLKTLQAMTEASNAYKLGDTPLNLVNKKIPKDISREIASQNSQLRDKLKNKPGTVWETYGLRYDGSDTPRVSWGMIWSPEGRLHITRGGADPGEKGWGFGGWGSAPGLESIRTVYGLDAVPAYFGPKQEMDRWIYHLLKDRHFNYHNVSSNPVLKPIRKFLETHPHAAPEEFKSHLAKIRNPALDSELAKISRGYLELSPSTDPESGATVQNVMYDGTRFNMKVVRLKEDNRVQITVDSDKPVALQFNRHWKGGSSSNRALASSNIIEVGGKTRTVTLNLETRD